MSLNISLPSLLFLFLIIPLSNGFNITSILEKGSDFTTFNSYLTQTQLASQINSRSAITVLAVDNSGISSISGKSIDVMKTILSLHVILDYYDEKKLQNLPKDRPTILTTLFQTTGNAIGLQGFLNVTGSSRHGVTIASATGTGQGVKLITSFAAQPYNISVLQVSDVIIPLYVDNNSKKNYTSNPPSASPNVAPTPSQAPKSPKPSIPSPSPSGSNMTNSSAPSSDDSNAPAPTTESPTEAPTESPIDAPDLAPVPAPASSEAPSNATAPTDAKSETTTDDGDSKKSSAHGVFHIGHAPTVVTMTLFFATFF